MVVGIVLFVLSWEWFWESTGSIFQTWHNVVGTIATVLSGTFMIRAWKRHGGAASADEH